MGRTKIRASMHKTGATSRRSRGWSCQRRDVEIQRRNVTEKVQVKNFQQFSKC